MDCTVEILSCHTKECLIRYTKYFTLHTSAVRWSQGAFSQLRLESQNDKKCDNFEEALVTNNGNIESVECAYHLKSYLLCKTISATANGQRNIAHSFLLYFVFYYLQQCNFIRFYKVFIVPGIAIVVALRLLESLDSFAAFPRKRPWGQS